MLATARLLKTAPPLRRGITTAQLDIVRATLPAVAAAGTKFTDHFYGRMLSANPELKNVFNQSTPCVDLFNAPARPSTRRDEDSTHVESAPGQAIQGPLLGAARELRRAPEPPRLRVLRSVGGR